MRLPYISNNQPVISVDAKKRELVGNFKNNGVEEEHLQPIDEVEEVCEMAAWFVLIWKIPSMAEKAVRVFFQI